MKKLNLLKKFYNIKKRYIFDYFLEPQNLTLVNFFKISYFNFRRKVSYKNYFISLKKIPIKFPKKLYFSPKKSLFQKVYNFSFYLQYAIRDFFKEPSHLQYFFNLNKKN